MYIFIVVIPLVFDFFCTFAVRTYRSIPVCRWWLFTRGKSGQHRALHFWKWKLVVTSG